MHPDYWHARWNEGRTGFNQPGGNPLLQRHWATLDLPAGSQVFVPLAGKSPDLLWLAARGHRVLAVELSPLAIEQFFAEHGIEPEVTRSRHGIHHRAGAIEMICGDVFDLDREVLSGCSAFYDRAALIALPEPLRWNTRPPSSTALRSPSMKSKCSVCSSATGRSKGWSDRTSLPTSRRSRRRV